MSRFHQGITWCLVFGLAGLSGTPFSVKAEVSPAVSEEDYETGLATGERDAKYQVKASWMLVGALLGPLGYLPALALPIKTLPERVAGKSPEYVRGYEKGYRRMVRKKRVIYNSAGFAITALTAGLTAAELSDTQGR